MIRAALIALALLAPPAAAHAAAQQPGEYYTIRAASTLRALLRDPGSATYVERTDPFWIRFPKAVVVCVRLNARNGFGGYTGTQVHSVVFYSQDNVKLLPETDFGCDRQGWKPFTEFTGR